jgi:hypothetical protein
VRTSIKNIGYRAYKFGDIIIGNDTYTKYFILGDGSLMKMLYNSISYKLSRNIEKFYDISVIDFYRDIKH